MTSHGVRVVVFANNWVGWKVVECLREAGDEIVALVLHPQERRQHGDDLIRSAGVPPEGIFDASTMGEAATLARLGARRPTIGISALFGYLLRPAVLGLIPDGCLNLHPGLLPYGRGAHPNVWSIVDRTPAGVTLHYVDAGVDTGDIVVQQEVGIEAIDTGESLYRKLERAAVALFREAWPVVRAGRAPRRPQPLHGGTTHRIRDLETITEIDPQRLYRAGDLIDLLRARTFPPYPGMFVRHGEGRVYLELTLRYEPPRGHDGR